MMVSDPAGWVCFCSLGSIVDLPFQTVLLPDERPTNTGPLRRYSFTATATSGPLSGRTATGARGYSPTTFKLRAVSAVAMKP